MTYTPKTDQQLKEVALGLRSGTIFSSDQVSQEQVGRVFLLLAFMAPEDRQVLQADEITFCYEYLENALPRGINGLPMFHSMHMLNRADHLRLIELAKKIEAALAGV